MKPIQNYEQIKAETGEISRPGAGGYICVIKNVEDIPEDPKTGKGDYLKIEYDFAAGEFKDYYSNAYARFGGFWGGTMYRSYKEKAQGMFKHFINCVIDSNIGFKWDFDENKLVGRFIGLVLGEEEYQKRDGSIGKRLYVKSVLPVQDIKGGNFYVPDLKKLDVGVAPSYPTSTSPSFTELGADDELPF